MSERFNPPPNWPEPPHDGWIPPADFRPRYTWGPVPAGWRLWLQDGSSGRGEGPLQDSEDVPASGARPRARIGEYPVSVINPGMWSENHLENEDYGFPPAPPVKRRPRLRLAMTIAVTAIGFLIALLTTVGFVWLTEFAIAELPGLLGEVEGHLSAQAQLVTPTTPVPTTPDPV